MSVTNIHSDRHILPSWRRNACNTNRKRKPAPPNQLQRAALIAARNGVTLTLTRGCGLGVHGLWIAETPQGAHRTDVIMACKRRGWLTEAPGFENAMQPNWAPVVITAAGREALAHTSAE